MVVSEQVWECIEQHAIGNQRFEEGIIETALRPSNKLFDGPIFLVDRLL